MKNIKKSLALVLAFVMILGLCTIGAGAAFNDASKITPAYATAVNVMAGMGILEGSDDDGDGKFDFNPQGNVTRAQAAKIIAYVMLGKKTAESLPAGAVFDIKATDWQSKYVKYLSKQGIINGYSATSFGSNDPVTANQLAKMLLSACGYGDQDEYVGDGWDVNVFVTATGDNMSEYNIFDDCDVADYDAAASRELACQITYNAMMNLQLVRYSEDDGYVLQYMDGAKTLAKTFGASKYNAKTITAVVTGCQATGEEYTVVTEDYSLAKTYNLNIALDASLVGHELTICYNSDAQEDADDDTYYNVYYYKDESKLVNTFALNPAMYSSLGGAKLTYNTTLYTYWVNNYPQDNTTYKDIDWQFNAKDAPTGYAYSLTGNDYRGSYILGKDGDIIGFTTSDYYVDKVTKVTTTAGSQSITLYSTGPIENNSSFDNVKEYDGIAVGDYVSVVKNGNVYELTKCTVSENVTVSTYDKYNTSKTINGSLNMLSSSRNKIPTADQGVINSITIGSTYNFYIDYKGSYFAAKLVSGAGNANLAFVTYAYYKTSATGYGDTDYSYYAQVVDAKGAETNYLITPSQFAALGGVAPTASTAPVSKQVKKLYTVYTMTENDYYNKQTVGVFTAADTTGYSQTFTSSNKVYGTYYTDAETVYVYVNGYASSLVTSISTTKPLGQTYTIYCVPDDSTTNLIAKVIFIKDVTATNAGTTFIYSSGIGNYIQPSKLSAQDANGDYMLSAFLDGTFKTDIKVTPATASTGLFADDMFFGYRTLNLGFYSYIIDSEGYYTFSAYDGTTDDNAIVKSELITEIFNNKMTTKTTVEEVNIANAKVVDLTGNGIDSIEKLNEFYANSYNLVISCYVYNYDFYLRTYGAGYTGCTTDVIYIEKCQTNPILNNYPGQFTPISHYAIGSDSITIQWTQPDDLTAASAIKYKVYVSTSDNIGSVLKAETNGTLKGSATGVTQFAITGLTPSTNYYITVIAEDADGNKTAATYSNFSYETLVYSTYATTAAAT